ncbi:phage pre-tape measure protein [Neoroseomonas oryzicola]|uniref:Uncharacterized protein n=1 Tax=Neoroseomonas oryzicola TaxID=535904 RepID=A0A9X9WDG8_9PROT|nr:hypothetical protein [Neoroseomonas oryzicola]MBR0658378.1 hypothetical protein [Neoroseomonas oryzicola]NKE18543.1 hypothetical protein [Neoroseomonas oryzicola]
MTGRLAALASIAAECEDVVLSRGVALSVRALSAEDIATLVGEYAADIAVPLRSIRAEPVASVLALLEIAPRAIAHVIALASDEPDQVEAARRLPFGVVLHLLGAIDRLTFGQSGDRRPFAEILGPLIGPHLPSLH